MKTKPASPLISPCLESTRCLLVSKRNAANLRCSAAGEVSSSGPKKRQSCTPEEGWAIVPTEDGCIVVQSLKSHRYLSCAKDGKVCTTVEANEDASKWQVELSPHCGIFLTSVQHGGRLACDENSEISVSQSRKGPEETWIIEFQSGELCFLSSPASYVRIRCDPTGIIDMSPNWKGWEVFRFVEAGDGSVYISSWTHSKFNLSSSADGRVLTTKERSLAERWTVVKAKSGEGVIITNRAHDMALATDGNRLFTTDNIASSATWTLEAANKNMFYLASAASGKYIGSIPCKRLGLSDAVMTKTRRAWEEWTAKETEDGSVTLRSNAHGLFLGVNKVFKVTLSDTAGPNEMWSVEESPHGGLFLISDEHRALLTCDTDGNLKAATGPHGLEETWRLEPRMPSSLSGPFIGAMIGAGVATVAFAAAMPMFVTGAIAGLGFTEAGIAAGSTAAGMMSAEAAAAGGAVASGGLVATCQSIGAAGLGFVGTSAAIGGGAVIGGGLSAVTLAGISQMNKSGNTEGDASIDCITPSTNRPFAHWETW